MQDADKVFLEYVVKALVDNPNDVVIERTVDEMGVLISLTVNPADMGKIIGRMGNTAKAIRTLLRIIGMKNNARVNLKINEPEGGMRHSDSEGVTSGMVVPPRAPGERSPGAAPATLKTIDEAMDEIKGI
jgi:predicted RNA-binding protein YlqC (UPF0109 family)